MKYTILLAYIYAAGSAAFFPTGEEALIKRHFPSQYLGRRTIVRAPDVQRERDLAAKLNRSPSSSKSSSRSGSPEPTRPRARVSMEGVGPARMALKGGRPVRPRPGSPGFLRAAAPDEVTGHISSNEAGQTIRGRAQAKAAEVQLKAPPGATAHVIKHVDGQRNSFDVPGGPEVRRYNAVSENYGGASVEAKVPTPGSMIVHAVNERRPHPEFS